MLKKSFVQIAARVVDVLFVGYCFRDFRVVRDKNDDATALV